MLVGNKNSLWGEKKIVNPIYNDLKLALSLRRYNNWSNAVMQLRRDSDNATAFVFFNGNTISLSSLISTISNTTPSATSLGTWVGSDNAYVTQLIGQTPNNVINPSYILSQSNTALQPKFITGGVVFVKNSLPSIDYTGGLKTLSVDGDFMTSGTNYTVLNISGNDTNIGVGVIYSTLKLTNPFAERLACLNDRRSDKVTSLIQTEIAIYVNNLLAQQNSSSQRLLTDVGNTSKLLKSYYNSVLQSSFTYSGTYQTDTLKLGAQQNDLSPLEGNIQEFLLWDLDKTSDLTEIHIDINDYYSIY